MHTVRFSDGRTVRFRDRRSTKPRRRSSPAKYLPYLFASGERCTLPKGLAKGELFKVGRQVYVAVVNQGERYGQPVTLRK